MPRAPSSDRPTSEGDELFAFLGLDQIVADTSRPVSRAALSRRVLAALWALRVFVVVVSLMVIYTFVHQF